MVANDLFFMSTLSIKCEVSLLSSLFFCPSHFGGKFYLLPTTKITFLSLDFSNENYT